MDLCGRFEPAHRTFGRIFLGLYTAAEPGRFHQIANKNQSRSEAGSASPNRARFDFEEEPRSAERLRFDDAKYLVTKRFGRPAVDPVVSGSAANPERFGRAGRHFATVPERRELRHR